MATYAELFGLQNDTDLSNRVAVAVVVAAETIRTEATETENHANRLLWAARVFQAPLAEGQRVYWAVLAANRAAPAAQITGASDAAIQTNVDAVVNLFAVGT